jgi:outer membrane protein OmpA-like peptidoglycan-associated protein
MKRFFTCGVLACGLAVASAQNAPLKTSEVTESAIVEALAPPAPPEPASGPRARGFRPALQAQAGRPPPSSSVLITFVTGSAELTAESRAALDVVARALGSGRLANLSFAVEGHADPRGDAHDNLRLSRLRAESVADYLAKEHGIARERLQAVGKGSAEPLNRNVPEAAENRRVTFVTRMN